uniref:Sodium channel, voltage-gated, type IV, beta a n=1 Tax=Astyanax mexicanus TaxID=7994 RepID=A0A8B9HM67_ASTMX
MELGRNTGSLWHKWTRSGDVVHAGLVITLLIGKSDSLDSFGILVLSIYITQSSSTALIIKKVHKKLIKISLCEAVIPAEGVEPNVKIYHERVEFVGSSKENNISILLWNVTFEDEGEYTCFAINPKEKKRNHSAIFTLYVVDQLKEVDNTLTIIIVSVLGGVIGLIIIVMVIKAIVVHFLNKAQEKNKECLVSSSGNDNTENGLSGSKADNKASPKA